MARQSRFVLLGHPQHVIQRGNNRDVIFIAKEDYQFYLEKLKDGCEKYSCDIQIEAIGSDSIAFREAVIRFAVIGSLL